MRQNPKGAILGLDTLVASRHIVVATDYPGLGTQGPIGYLVGKGQAQAVIDSVRAAKQIPGVGGGNRYALWGYSQGGHAVLFAALLSRSYAPELRLIGVAAVAPPTDLKRLLLAGINTIEGRIFTSYTLGSWALKYGLSLAALADPAAITHIQNLGANCSDNFSSQLDLLSSQKPLKDKFLSQNPLKVQGWSKAVADNSITSLSAATPALILQGGLDSIVLPQVTQQFVRFSCKAGATIKYVELSVYGHGGSANASVDQATNWINDRFRGVPAPSSCH
jgi:acetyl esterase/lipase